MGEAICYRCTFICYCHCLAFSTYSGADTRSTQLFLRAQPGQRDRTWSDTWPPCRIDQRRLGAAFDLNEVELDPLVMMLAPIKSWDRTANRALVGLFGALRGNFLSALVFFEQYPMRQEGPAVVIAS
jgi:hypothetical protein